MSIESPIAKVESDWEAELDAAKQKVRELFSRGEIDPASKNSIIEQVTGVKLYTPEEEHLIKICGEAITLLFASEELKLSPDRLLIPGYRLQQPEQ